MDDQGGGDGDQPVDCEVVERRVAVRDKGLQQFGGAADGQHSGDGDGQGAIVGRGNATGPPPEGGHDGEDQGMADEHEQFPVTGGFAWGRGWSDGGFAAGLEQ